MNNCDNDSVETLLNTILEEKLDKLLEEKLKDKLRFLDLIETIGEEKLNVINKFSIDQLNELSCVGEEKLNVINKFSIDQLNELSCVGEEKLQLLREVDNERFRVITTGEGKISFTNLDVGEAVSSSLVITSTVKVVTPYTNFAMITLDAQSDSKTGGIYLNNLDKDNGNSKKTPFPIQVFDTGFEFSIAEINDPEPFTFSWNRIANKFVPFINEVNTNNLATNTITTNTITTNNLTYIDSKVNTNTLELSLTENILNTLFRTDNRDYNSWQFGSTTTGVAKWIKFPEFTYFPNLRCQKELQIADIEFSIDTKTQVHYLSLSSKSFDIYYGIQDGPTATNFKNFNLNSYVYDTNTIYKKQQLMSFSINNKIEMCVPLVTDKLVVNNSALFNLNSSSELVLKDNEFIVSSNNNIIEAIYDNTITSKNGNNTIQVGSKDRFFSEETGLLLDSVEQDNCIVNYTMGKNIIQSGYQESTQGLSVYKTGGGNDIIHQINNTTQNEITLDNSGLSLSSVDNIMISANNGTVQIESNNNIANPSFQQ